MTEISRSTEAEPAVGSSPMPDGGARGGTVGAAAGMVVEKPPTPVSGGDGGSGEAAGVDGGAEGERTLRQRLERGSRWTFFAFGAGNAIRLISMLVMTRLLSPETYGEMNLVWLALAGLQMFSDIGAGPAIVRDKRGDDPVFLNTAWTMQVARGFGLTLAACVLAVPLAMIYQRPDLYLLMPVTALTALIGGFNSTKLFTAQRHLALGRLTLIELIQHVVAVTVMVLVAWWTPTVMALIAGPLAGSTVRMLLSHAILPGIRNRFMWDVGAYHSLFHFGKWIFLGSAIYFVAREGAPLLLNKYATLAMIGLYGLASQLYEAAIALVVQLCRAVLLPGLSSVARDDPARVSDAFYKARARLNLVFLPAIGALASGASVPIELLLNGKWWGAGGMLQAMAILAATRTLAEPCEQCVVALGRTRFVFVAHVLRAVWVLLGIPVGWYLDGIAGVLAASVTSEIVPLVLFWAVLYKERVTRFRREAVVIVLLGAGFLAGLGADALWERYGLPARGAIRDSVMHWMRSQP